MNKTESIARRIMGWKLNRLNRWFDYKKGTFISIDDFQPEEKLEHAMLIVERLQELGFTYVQRDLNVCFNDICETGHTLPQAITNAAYLIADSSPSLADEWV